MDTIVRKYVVRQDEIDVFGHLNNAVYVDCIHDSGLALLHQLGAGVDHLRAQGFLWQTQDVIISYMAQAWSGDTLEVETRISTISTSTVQFTSAVKRVSDGRALATARICERLLSKATMEPAAVTSVLRRNDHAEMSTSYADIRLRRCRAVDNGFVYEKERRVEIHEADSSGLATAGSLVRYVVQAYFDAARRAGLSLALLRKGPVFVIQGGHHFEIRSPIPAEMRLRIASRVVQVARVRGAWLHTLYDAETGVEMAQDYSVGYFVDRNGRPGILPPDVVETMISGPAEVSGTLK